MDQIAFSTLLVGLLVGVQPVRVELSADLHPAAVIYSLDGKITARVNAPPWKADIDFGTALRPLEITAEAVDASGTRLAGVSRLVNLPVSAASLDILIERNGLGIPRTARLVATSARKERPTRMTLTVDGQLLAVDETGLTPLPPLDLRQAHVLSGTAEFARDAVARADVAVGGGIADASGSRLTAVPIRLSSDEEPTVETLTGKIRHRGDALRVVAIDRPPSTVLVVRDPDSTRADRILGRNNPGTGVRLSPNDRVGLVWPIAHEEKIGDQEAQLLESTPYFTGQEAGLFWVLTRVSRPRKSMPPYRYADAVAVAAVEAYRSGAPRAVVLSGISGNDASQLTPEQVRGYLTTLGVPLHVWSYGSMESSWGEPQRLNSFVAYQRAATALKQDLDSQRIVWVAGEWLPGRIELASTPGISLLR